MLSLRCRHVCAWCLQTGILSGVPTISNITLALLDESGWCVAPCPGTCLRHQPALLLQGRHCSCIKDLYSSSFNTTWDSERSHTRRLLPVL